MRKIVVGPLQKIAARGSSKPGVCVYADCRSEVKFGGAREDHFCRRHEPSYLLDEEEATEDTILNLSARIGIRDDGCWQFEQVWGNDLPRPTITSAGLKWQVVRLLRVYYFGGHDAHLELGHSCHHAHCVHPGHVTPITGAKNRKDRDVLNADPESLTRTDRRRLDELVTEAEVVAAHPAVPGDEDSLYMLEKFTSTLGRALPVFVIDPVVIPAQAEPEPVSKPVKADLFLDTRPPQDARVRRRRRTVAQS